MEWLKKLLQNSPAPEVNGRLTDLFKSRTVKEVRTSPNFSGILILFTDGSELDIYTGFAGDIGYMVKLPTSDLLP